MEIVIGLIVLAAFAFLYRRTTKLNADPEQQLLARLIISAAETPNGHSDLVKYLIQSPWRAAETRKRLMHALSIVKVSALPETYASAKEIVRMHHDASYRLG